MKLISIVIPCYNSEATIRKVVEMVMEEFKKMDGYDCEFVLVNDGSPKDNTYGRSRSSVSSIRMSRASTCCAISVSTMR